MERRTRAAAGFCRRILVGTALLWFAAAGCKPRPHAPALDNSPIYQNEREGFRFMVPEGWSQRARSDVPEGTYSKERLLVSYQNLNAASLAVLEVTLVDLPEATDLSVRLGEPCYGVSTWRLKQEPEPVEFNGKSGRRFTYTGRTGKTELIREAVAVRRGERAYIFTGLYAPTDTSARDQLRGAIASSIWK